MGRLQSLIKGSSPTACLEVLSYFIAKLSSSQLTIRQLSLKVNNLEHYKFNVTIDNITLDVLHIVLAFSSTCIIFKYRTFCMCLSDNGLSSFLFFCYRHSRRYWVLAIGY